MEIRPARKVDAEYLTNHSDLFVKGNSENPFGPENLDSKLLVATENDAPVAFLRLSFSLDEPDVPASLEGPIVAVGQWSKAKSLIEAILKDLSDKRCSHVYAMTADTGTKLLYNQLGFVADQGAPQERSVLKLPWAPLEELSDQTRRIQIAPRTWA
jgi:hypothetical protein